MKTISVHLERDHLERLAATKSPITAIAELIWNSLDADASLVAVNLERNECDGIVAVRISDNGHGLRYDDAFEAFGKLGGSRKRNRLKTAGGRIIHGKQGKGRFHAFAIGNKVIWSIRYRDDGNLFEYSIEGSRSDLQNFKITAPREGISSESGTSAEIFDIQKPPKGLGAPRSRQILNEEYALYLRQYSNIKIYFDDQILDPAIVEDFVKDYTINDVVLEDGRLITAELTIVEWKIQTERVLFLCDEHGFTLSRITPGIHARGFEFTAYLKSSLIRELNVTGELLLEELHPDLNKIILIAKERLRTHFRRRSAEKAENQVEQWKKEDIYPYIGNPRDPIEEAERHVFDVLALNVNDYLPDFDISSRETKKLSFGLLKTALETSPDAVHKILQDVLKLPQEKQCELAELLERTSLEAIINASKIVTDRLDFLRGLEVLVFDEEVKEKTLERRHLHKIIAEHTWLFGEEFNLTLSDASLTNVLKRHLDLSQIDVLEDIKPVLREDGSTGIIDLMLSRIVPQPRPDQNEHLVIELKRPNVIIDNKAASQIKDYATAIVKDERFLNTNTRWEFWAVSNAMSESVMLEASQSNRPFGIIMEHEELKMRIWIKTWGQIINESSARLRFFQEKLKLIANEDTGIKYLKSVHKKYLPDILLEDDKGSEVTQT